MNLESYLKENYPNILDEYEKFLRKDILPKIGDEVVSLVSGYGSIKAGVPLIVIDIVKKGQKANNGKTYWDNYIYLVAKYDKSSEYLCNVCEWWKELRIVSK